MVERREMVRGALQGSCHPVLYIYDLPDRYRHEGRPSGRGFGRPVATQPRLPPSTRLFVAPTYGTGAVFYEAALQYQCRTLTPELADLFFIPTFTDAFRRQKVCVDAPPGQPKNCSRDALFLRLRAVRNSSGVRYLGRVAVETTYCSRAIRASGSTCIRVTRSAIATSDSTRLCSSV